MTKIRPFPISKKQSFCGFLKRAKGHGASYTTGAGTFCSTCGSRIYNPNFSGSRDVKSDEEILQKLKESGVKIPQLIIEERTTLVEGLKYSDSIATYINDTGKRKYVGVKWADTDKDRCLEYVSRRQSEFNKNYDTRGSSYEEVQCCRKRGHKGACLNNKPFPG